MPSNVACYIKDIKVESFFISISLDFPLKVRLVGGTSPNKGRVEVYRNGFWGTICKDGWNIPDASVVCRMLGYSGAWTAGCCTEYPGGTGPVWLSDLSCTGEEKSLTECGHSGWGINNCDHGKDVNVICNSPPTEKPSRLSSVEANPTTKSSQSLYPSATTTSTSSVVHSTVKSTTIQMSPSLSSSTRTSKVQDFSSLHTSSARVSATPTASTVSQKPSFSSTLFTVVVPSVVSPTLSSMVLQSSVSPTLPPGR